jgi:hypothetical protein
MRLRLGDPFYEAFSPAYLPSGGIWHTDRRDFYIQALAPNARSIVMAYVQYINQNPVMN